MEPLRSGNAILFYLNGCGMETSLLTEKKLEGIWEKTRKNLENNSTRGSTKYKFKLGWISTNLFISVEQKEILEGDLKGN